MSDLLLLADGPGYTGLFADFNTTFWSGVLRIAYAMVAAAPFLAAGMFTAGILRGMVGAATSSTILTLPSCRSAVLTRRTTPRPEGKPTAAISACMMSMTTRFGLDSVNSR